MPETLLGGRDTAVTIALVGVRLRESKGGETEGTQDLFERQACSASTPVGPVVCQPQFIPPVLCVLPPVQLASGSSVLLSSLAHYFTSHCLMQNLFPHLCPTHVA